MVKSDKMSSKEMQQILIENFVGLQKAMTNLSIKFESLSEQMSRLLEVFELSAKNFSTSNPAPDTKDFEDKINAILDQNKTLARGLVLLEEKMKSSSSSFNEREEDERQDIKPRPLPRI